MFTTFSYPQRALKRFAKKEQDKESSLLMQWTSAAGGSEGKGLFYTPLGLARDHNGNIYVVDAIGGKIIKFDADGKDGKQGSAGEFILPVGIAIDSKNNVYVSDIGNLRIQKFTAEGEFLSQWRKFEGLSMPGAITIDENDIVYIADFLGGQIKTFDVDGNLLETFGEQGRCGGLDFFVSIALYNNKLYAADLADHRIEIFDLENKQDCPIPFGRRGDLTLGVFESPAGITVDENGTLYVADAENSRVQIFSPECIDRVRLDSADNTCVKTIGGIQGILPDQLSQPAGLVVTPEGKLYVGDLQLDRIQVFSKMTFNSGKAIIIAGRNQAEENKSASTDGLWTATQAIANYAYYTLRFKGFRRDEIHYLSPDFSSETPYDENQSVIHDKPTNDKNQSIINDKPTEENIKVALDWAVENNPERNLTLFMIDHGGKGVFNLNGTDMLKASELYAWLNEKDFNHVNLIYEACHSGSFLEPEQINKLKAKSWVAVTSAAADEIAYLSSQGSLAFSNFFWNHIFAGLNIKEAFDKAKQQAVEGRKTSENEEQKQTPQMKGQGDVFIGNGIKLQEKSDANKSESRIEIDPDQKCKDTALGLVCEYDAEKSEFR